MAARHFILLGSLAAVAAAVWLVLKPGQVAPVAAAAVAPSDSWASVVDPWALDVADPWAAEQDANALAPVLDVAVAPVADALDMVGPFVASLFSMGAGYMELQSYLSEPNVRAFLAMIRAGEGTSGPAGYSTLYGGGTFAGFLDHPRIKVTAGAYTSTAAGAYQILAGTWDEVKRALQLMDFTPASQDIAALWLIWRRGALDAVRAGRFDEAVRKTNKEWASLPGSPYGQPTRTLAQAEAVYLNAGGVLA